MKQQLDNSFPFFPYKLWKSKNGDGLYETKNHLTANTVRLNRQAAEVLYYANGENSLADIVNLVSTRNRDAGKPVTINQQILSLFNSLANHELIWWREVPLEKVPVRPPTSIFWEITEACNLRCLHCVVAAGHKNPDELTLDRCLALAGELADAGVENVAFSGGEPLVHPHFQTLAERVHDLGMWVQISTNGTLVTREIAEWMKALDAEVQVSLDGSSPDIHDAMRPGREAFNRTIQGIKNLVAAGHELTIGSVISNLNIEDIPSIIQLAEQLGVARFRPIPFVPKGRGGTFNYLEVTPSMMKRVTQNLKNIREKVSITITELEFEHMLGGNTCPETLDLKRSLGCSGAVSYATITPIGEVLPCHFFEGVRADNITNSSFQEVWYSSRYLNYFRHLSVADLHGACRKCSCLAQCGGSCRAINFSKGDFLGGNRQCWIAEELEMESK